MVNTWFITLKEVKLIFRNKLTLFLMLALPIILMLILGTALSNAFSSGMKIGDLKLLFHDQTTNEQLTAYWNGFTETMSEEGLVIEDLQEGMDGHNEVRSNRFSAYAELNDTGLEFYTSSRNTVEGQILQGMLTIFADRYSLAAAAYQIDPSSAQTVIQSASQSREFIEVTTLDRNKQPSSMGYYAIAVSTMIALYSAMSASELFRSERTRNTAMRLMAAPISKGEVFVGKIIGCTLTNFLCILAVVLFSKYVYSADWGTHYGMALLVLLTEVLFAVSFGLCVGLSIPGNGYAGVVMIFAQVASFIGGAYFPLGEMEGFMKVISSFSPLEWANTALIQMIYANDLSAAWSAIGLNIGFALLMLLVSILLVQRKEAL